MLKKFEDTIYILLLFERSSWKRSDVMERLNRKEQRDGQGCLDKHLALISGKKNSYDFF